ncbi:hypothetical protein KJ766_00970, partial [Patescibacteria group bacterium]|nr:hypothetical protein [Patescibacteria group bacterium]
ILSNSEMTNAFSMDRNQIQSYLDRGFLGDYYTEDWTGVKHFATDIIQTAAQTHGISPKFLLVLLQKEQSLIEDDSPSDSQLDWATGYAVCDDCSKSDSSIQRWKGFGKQVNSAAMQFTDGYLADIEATGSTQGKYGPGISVEIDDIIVTPANAATATLFAYTPHIQGNENFANIWNRWFSHQYPTGTLLQVEGEPGIYLIEYGYKRAIHSWSAFKSRFDENLIIEVSKNTLQNYPDGSPIDFPNYSLLQDENGRIYLLVDDSLRYFENMETFYSIGFHEDEIMQIENADLVYFDSGEPITSTTANPQGALLRVPSGGVFFIENGMRHAIIDPSIIKTRFKNFSVVSAESSAVEQYKEGAPIGFSDGYLIKQIGEPTVYVISEGKKLPIASEEVFESFGYSWTDIIEVDEYTARLHQTGLPIDESI